MTNDSTKYPSFLRVIDGEKTEEPQESDYLALGYLCEHSLDFGKPYYLLSISNEILERANAAPSEFKSLNQKDKPRRISYTDLDQDRIHIGGNMPNPATNQEFMYLMERIEDGLKCFLRSPEDMEQTLPCELEIEFNPYEIENLPDIIRDKTSTDSALRLVVEIKAVSPAELFEQIKAKIYTCCSVQNGTELLPNFSEIPFK